MYNSYNTYIHNFGEKILKKKYLRRILNPDPTLFINSNRIRIRNRQTDSAFRDNMTYTHSRNKTNPSVCEGNFMLNFEDCQALKSIKSVFGILSMIFDYYKMGHYFLDIQY